MMVVTMVDGITWGKLTCKTSKKCDLVISGSDAENCHLVQTIMRLWYTNVDVESSQKPMLSRKNELEMRGFYTTFLCWSIQEG